MIPRRFLKKAVLWLESIIVDKHSYSDNLRLGAYLWFVISRAEQEEGSNLGVPEPCSSWKVDHAFCG